MRISSTGAIEGGRVLYTIGTIEAASTWHPARGSPLQENWRELILRELIRNAEDIDADAAVTIVRPETVDSLYHAAKFHAAKGAG
jgi:hypothetical protein